MGDLGTEFLLGDRRAAHLALRPVHRERAGSSDFHNGYWLITSVRIQAGGFTGAFRANRGIEELGSSHNELTALNEDLK